MLRTTICALLLVAVAQCAVRRDTAVHQAFGGFKSNCHAKAGGGMGCKCEVDYGNGVEIREFEDDIQCKVPLEMQVAENKKAVNKELKDRVAGFRENCFPKPSGGCKCNVNYGRTGDAETVEVFNTDAECRVSTEDQPVQPKFDAETAANKKKVNEEINQKFGDFKENCFPRGSGKGCKCTEGQDANGHDIVATYDADNQCRELIPRNDHRDKREARDVAADTRQQQQQQINARARTQQKTGSDNAPSQNVRDPVRDQAQANYRKVVEELNQKFKGLKEGCFPRPKGCLCVVGKTAEGREVTERRMKDVDCKCKEGEKGPGCPAA